MTHASSVPQASIALAAANTVYAVRGRVHDGVDGVSALCEWVDHHAVVHSTTGRVGGQRVSELHLASFQVLRKALRSLFAATASGSPGDPGAIAILNEFAASAPRWSVLTFSGSDYSVAEQTSAGPAEAALAAIAGEGARLLASAQSRIRLCAAPGCVQFFLADHPRRRWCSPGCGNRARAARHYRRHNRHRPDDGG